MFRSNPPNTNRGKHGRRGFGAPHAALHYLPSFSMCKGFCSPPPLPLSFPSPLSLPPSPLSLPTLSFPSPSRSPLSPFPSPSRCPPLPSRRRRLVVPPSRRSPLPLAAPLSPLAPLPLATPLSPLAIADSSFPSPSRCPPLVPLFQSAVRGYLQHPSPSHTHPPTHPRFSSISHPFHLSALKLLRKHGSLENLLQAATIRTVGKQYAQDALTKHADYLRKNYEVLSLRRDVDVHLEEKWLSERDTSNDSAVLSNFMKELGQSQKLSYRNASISG
ncbi:hypothetical protein ACLOJK_009287 [Asimina triloba]